MKELNIPYIGVKIESLPTILRTLKSSRNDNEFIEYYLDIGKSAKTASEYLASLRNLKLARRDEKGKTVLLPAGNSMIDDNVQRLYASLLQHCLKNFPDLKIIKEILTKEKVDSLDELIQGLNRLGYTVKRKQTLSSYYKLFFEAEKVPSKMKNGPIAHKYLSEPLEFNQFIKLLFLFSKRSEEGKISIKDFFYWINDRYTVERDVFLTYLVLLKSEGRVKFYEINPKILKDLNDAFEMGGKYYYYIELL